MFDLFLGRAALRVPVAGLLGLLALFGARGVEAQAAAADKAAAEILYDRGIALMRDGKTAEACSQFEQSQAIERGIGTMLHLAECYEQLGRTASAWALFREAASTARFEGQTDRVKWGNERAAALAPKLSMLTVQVAQENQIAGFTLTRDGAAVAPGLWNVPVPVDPGVHKLSAQAPDYHDWSGEVTVGADADTVTLRVPPLTRKPQAAAPVSIEPLGTRADSGTPGRTSVSNARDGGSGGSSTQRTVGLIVGGVGVAGLAVGGVFGTVALSKKGDIDDCRKNMATCSRAKGDQLTKSANNAAKLANVFAIGGGALVVTGLVLFLTGGSSDDGAQTAFAVDVDRAGARLTVGGAF